MADVARNERCISERPVLDGCVVFPGRIYPAPIKASTAITDEQRHYDDDDDDDDVVCAFPWIIIVPWEGRKTLSG